MTILRTASKVGSMRSRSLFAAFAVCGALAGATGCVAPLTRWAPLALTPGALGAAPPEVRVTRTDGSVVKVYRAGLDADTLVGWGNPVGTYRRIRIPLGEVRSVETRSRVGPAAPLAAGARVRLRLRGPGRGYTVTGSLLALTADSVAILPAASVRRAAYPRAALAGLDVPSYGRATARGLLVGGLAGTVIGAGVGFAGGGDPDALMVRSASAAAAVGSVLLGTLGAVGGAILGANTTAERWRPLGLDGVHIGVSPAPH